VGAAGIEPPSFEPDSLRSVAKTCELAQANSPGATVGDDSRRPEAVPTDADAAIRLAAKLAIDGGDFERARALLDLLAPKSPAADAASVTPLALLRGKGRQV